MIWYLIPGILLLVVSAFTLYANRGLARINRRDDGMEKEMNVAYMVTACWPITDHGERLAGLLGEAPRKRVFPIVGRWRPEDLSQAVHTGGNP